MEIILSLDSFPPSLLTMGGISVIAAVAQEVSGTTLHGYTTNITEPVLILRVF